MLFLMKQVKHHNGSIYYAIYKSSWAILNTNEMKKLQKKLLKLFIRQNGPLASIAASQILGILSQKNWR